VCEHGVECGSLRGTGDVESGVENGVERNG
jgi:hypothetical protein